MMSRVRGRDNKSTEMALVEVFRRFKITGWRRQRTIPLGIFTERNKPRHVTPDFVFPGRRLAIFVDGCFWHGCPLHATLPKTNTDFWMNKIQKNKARDKIVASALRERGWCVMRIWEHSLTPRGTPALVRRLRRRISVELWEV